MIYLIYLFPEQIVERLVEFIMKTWFKIYEITMNGLYISFSLRYHDNCLNDLCLQEDLVTKLLDFLVAPHSTTDSVHAEDQVCLIYETNFHCSTFFNDVQSLMMLI